MEQLIIIAALIVVGYTFGRYAEAKHYRSIKAREIKLISLPCTSNKHPMCPEANITDCRLITGNAVISVDYFKQFVAGLRGLFGGRLTTYESLLDRARREAILRMKESATDAREIINLRLETFSVSKGNQSNIGSVEVFAYATAVYIKEEHSQIG